MGQSIAIPVGVSAWINVGRNRAEQKWIDYAARMKTLEKTSARDFDLQTNNDLLSDLIEELVLRADTRLSETSAEMFSTLTHGISADDEILFLCSDTGDGALCANALAQTFVRLVSGIRCKIVIVDGLRVDDPDAFLDKAVIALAEALTNFFSGKNADQCFINITSGFKAVLPYLTIHAATNGWTLFYLFERSDKIIEIPRLPLADVLAGFNDATLQVAGRDVENEG